MKLERLFVIALVAVSVLSAIPQIPVGPDIWALLLVVVGIVGGVMINYPDLDQRILIYVIAASLAMISDPLANVPAVGDWLTTLFDNMAVGIQGMAMGLLVMGLLARAKG